MSRTPAAFAPDPTKWIDTSKSSSKPKHKPQRPLVGFRSNLNIATPPPSTIRRTIAVGRQERERDETPLARQAGLMGYLTPPTTAGPDTTKPRQRLERLRMEVDKALQETTPTAVNAQRGGKRRVDEFWGSSSDAEPGPSKVPRSAATAATAAERVTPRGMKKPAVLVDVEEDEQVEPIDRLGGKENQLAPVVLHSPARLLSQSTKPTPSQRPIRSSHLPPPRSPPRSTSPSLEGSSDTEHPVASSTPMRTPIPDHVLALHKQLCGRDTQRMKRVRSPWRAPGDPSSPVAPPRSPRKDVDTRVQGVKAKKKEDGGKQKALVSLSDEESELGAKRKRRKADGQDRESDASRGSKVAPRRKAFVTGFVSPTKKLKPARSRNPDGMTEGDGPPAQSRVMDKQHSMTTTRDTRLIRSPSITSDSAHDVPKIDNDIHLQSSSPTSHSLTPRSPSPLTPSRAQRRAISHRHHNVTPPKTRSAKKLHEHSETLFAFPPPPQPDFGIAKEDKQHETKRQWKPVEMHAETLMTWSLGNVRSDPTKSFPLGEQSEAAKEQHGVTAGRVRPDPTPMQSCSGERKRSNSTSSDTESLAASMVSQSFPNLVRSSPSKKSSSNPSSEPTGSEEAQDGDNAAVMPPSKQPSQPSSLNLTDLPPSSPPKVDTPQAEAVQPVLTETPRVKRAEDRWKGLQAGILSVPVASSAKSTPSQGKPASQKRKRKSPGKGKEEGQTKLAAFGFFPDESAPMSGSLRETFDKSWDEEEDLAFDKQADCLPTESAGKPRDGQPAPALSAQGRKMGKVPDAPWHPELRPAGIAELQRREARRKRSQSQHDCVLREQLVADEVSVRGKVESSDRSSSLTSSDPLFPEHSGGDARRWFEGIGERRSSEFGSFRDD